MTYEYGETRTSLAPRRSGSLSHQGDFALSVGALERSLLSLFPAADAEPWDRTGLTTGNPESAVRGVALALDPTVSAIRTAAKLGANVLVTHHPAFLAAPDSFMPGESAAVHSGAGVWAAVSEGVSVMSFHTALDVSPRAQKVLPGMLGLQLCGVVEPKLSSKEKGYGQRCVFPEGQQLTLGQFAARCTSVFGRAPRVWGDFSRMLTSVATCTGSIGSTGRAALAQGIQCVVCGEVKYHEALDLAGAGLCIVDLGHDVSETPLVGVLANAVYEAGVPENQVFLLEGKDLWSYPEAVRV